MDQGDIAAMHRRAILNAGACALLAPALSAPAAAQLPALVPFDLDNGKTSCRSGRSCLPHFMYWLIPMAVGIPFVVRASVAAVGASARRIST